MCRYKSGIIFKNRIELAPEGNESHSDLLKKLGVEDNTFNASKKFVRAELIPPNGNKNEDIKKWDFNVDQDILPDWFSDDPKRFEQEFRNKVSDYLKNIEKIIPLFGYVWREIKAEDRYYYILDGILERMSFGKNNNYAESSIDKFLNESRLLEELREKFGDNLLPIEVDLTSLDGFKDYGKISRLLTIPTIPFIMKYGEQIPLVDSYTTWTATPNQTKSRGDSLYVRCVDSDGRSCCDGCGWNYGGVRPLFSLKSSIFESLDNIG